MTNTAKPTARLSTTALAAAFCVFAACAAQAQSATNVKALEGLSPVAMLLKTPEGQAALTANLTVTGGIQTGEIKQPFLLPFKEQQLLALKDSFITDGNATELADGLGTKLGNIYQAKTAYVDWKTFPNISKPVADLIAYTNATTKSDSNAGKYFFANGTKNGKEPVTEAVSAKLLANGGTFDVFGKAYDRPAGSPGADAYGNSRPFQTEPMLIAFRGPDYFGRPSHSLDWLRGPNQNLTDSPSYPSGHTTYGYTESLILALLVPERYQQMVARAAEYGNDRIVMGAHYAMDVLGGRTLSLYDVAHLLANDPAYVGRTLSNAAAPSGMGQGSGNDVTIADFPAAVRAARADLKAILEAACGDTIARCAADDQSRFKDAAANETMYKATQTYGLPFVHATAAGAADVGKLAPEAGNLLTAAFPSLTLAEANDILTATLGPGGGFLDDGSAFGIYSRINLYAAAGKAAALAATRQK